MLVHNPFIKKMQLANGNEAAASYKGILFKNLWFWGLCLLGMFVYTYVPFNAFPISVIITALVLVIVCPIVIYFFPTTAWLAGSLYSVLQGYLLAFIVNSYFIDYGMYVWLAILLTALISFVLFILYMRRIIKVNQKVRAFFLSLFIISILFSLIVYMSTFFTDALSSLFIADGVLSIVITISMLVIAIINLVFEFDYAVQVVTKKAAKKYEWVAGYGLFMSILFIFMRILEIFERFSGENK